MTGKDKFSNQGPGGQGRSFAAAAGTPRLRSLFLDGNRGHARLNLPVVAVPADSDGASSMAALLAAGPGAAGLDDLEPRAGDLVPFTFRLLSAAYLGGGGYHLDFSREGVLAGALPLFLEPEAAGSARQSPLIVVRDHSFEIEDRIGLVRNARWNPPAGSLLHPGIDAELCLDWKLAGDVVRRLLHDPPLLDACSVSLGFGWEKSHPELADEPFWSRLGEEVDGSPVRVVVTGILAVEHVGLVFAGADPLARRRAEGAGPHRDMDEPQPARVSAALTADLSREPAAAPTTEGGDPPMEARSITLSADSPLWDLLGVEQMDLAHLERRAAELKSLAELGRETLAELRREVQALIVRLDGASESEPFDSAQGRLSEGLLQMVPAADMATLRALRDEYARRLEALVPARCQVCGSAQVSRRSSREVSLVAPVRGEDDPGLYR